MKERVRQRRGEPSYQGNWTAHPDTATFNVCETSNPSNEFPINQDIINCHQNCIEANFNFLYNNCAVLGDDSEKRLPADEETAVSPATQDLEFWVKLKQLVVYFIEEDRDIYTHHLNQ